MADGLYEEYDNYKCEEDPTKKAPQEQPQEATRAGQEDWLCRLERALSAIEEFAEKAWHEVRQERVRKSFETTFTSTAASTIEAEEVTEIRRELQDLRYNIDQLTKAFNSLHIVDVLAPSNPYAHPR